MDVVRKDIKNIRLSVYPPTRTVRVSAPEWVAMEAIRLFAINGSQLRNIRLNTELAKKPPECLEYIVVHELVHLREPTHSDRFVALMNQLMPHWRDHREMMNRLPVRYEG